MGSGAKKQTLSILVLMLLIAVLEVLRVVLSATVMKQVPLVVLVITLILVLIGALPKVNGASQLNRAQDQGYRRTDLNTVEHC